MEDSIEAKKSSHILKIIVLMLLVFLFALSSGYFYTQLQKEKKIAQECNSENEKLLANLRDPLLNSTLEGSKVVSVDSIGDKVTVKGPAGQEVTLSVTDKSKINEMVVAIDKKTRAFQSAKILDVKKGAVANVIFNGNKEIISLTFTVK